MRYTPEQIGSIMTEQEYNDAVPEQKTAPALRFGSGSDSNGTEWVVWYHCGAYYRTRADVSSISGSDTRGRSESGVLIDV